MSGYFDTLRKLKAAFTKQQMKKIAKLTRKSVEQIPAMVLRSHQTDGGFYIKSIPCLENGGKVLALFGDREGLERMREVIQPLADLAPWEDKVEKHFRELEVSQEIRDIVEKHSGCEQKDIKKYLSNPQGANVANLIQWLEKAEMIRRKKNKKGVWLVYSPTDTSGAPDKVKLPVPSHRAGVLFQEPSSVDISKLSLVPMPSATIKFSCPEINDYPLTQDIFAWEFHSATQCQVEKIVKAEQMDVAFRKMYPLQNGTLMLDDLGNAIGMDQNSASMMFVPADQSKPVVKDLSDSIKRFSLSPLGKGFLALSGDGVLHGYNQDFDLALETHLAKSPEYQTVLERCKWEKDGCHHYMRAVALAPDAKSYIHTLLDTAWCISFGGELLWGIKFPELPYVGQGDAASWSQDNSWDDDDDDFVDEAEEAFVDNLLACAYGSDGKSFYIAGGSYSGHVLKLNERREAVRQYTIGDRPNRIVNCGEHLYIQTEEWLYVIYNDHFCTRIHIPGAQVFIAQSGFGVIERKHFRWFTPTGTLLGSVISKDPIRRAYFRLNQLLVETKRHRCVLSGVLGTDGLL
jgi:hypothetical protein